MSLFLLVPLTFYVLAVGYSSQDASAAVGFALAGVAAAVALVLVGRRVAGDFVPATAPATGSVVRRSSRWDWTDVLAFLPATLGLLLLTDIAIVSPTQALDGPLNSDARTAVESFAAQTAFYVAAIGALVILLAWRRGLRIPDLGWRLSTRVMPWWAWVLVAVPVTIVTILVANELGILAQSLLPTAQNTQCTAVRTEYHGYNAIAIPLVCVIAPLSEESIFRGFFYGWLRRSLPVLPAVLIAAAVFAAAHAVLLLGLPLFAVGIVLTLLYEYSGSLIPGATVHALFNLYGIIQILGPTTTC